MHVSDVTFAGVRVSVLSSPPGQVVVEVSAALTVQTRRVVLAVALRAHLQTQQRSRFSKPLA